MDNKELVGQDLKVVNQDDRVDLSRFKQLNNELVKSMLERIVNCDAFFKPQQRDDPDLNRDEKLKIVTDLYIDKVQVFLTRFGKFLKEEDLKLFPTGEDDYIIKFHLSEIRKHLNTRENQILVKNRRYEAMKEMIESGTYFSDEEMKLRDPLLYEQMIGQYITEEEARATVDKSDLRFSTILLNHMDINRANILYEMQKDQEEGQEEEEEEDTDEEDEACHGTRSASEDSDNKDLLSDWEKQQKRHEFTRTMQLRFLAGQDNDFDYSKVDSNTEYDSLTIRQQDEEEKYFDSESPEVMDECILESSNVANADQMNINEDIDYMDFDLTSCEKKS